jgi:hypothetical protein
MGREHQQFLGSIKAYVAKKPVVAARIGDYTTEGLRIFAHDRRLFAVDIETIAMAVVCKKYKGRAGFILQKLEKQKHNLSFN